MAWRSRERRQGVQKPAMPSGTPLTPKRRSVEMKRRAAKRPRGKREMNKAKK